MFMKHVRTALAPLFFLLFGFPFPDNANAYKTVTFQGVEHRDIIKKDNLEEHANYKGYQINIYRNSDGIGILQILQKGKLVFEEEGIKYSLGVSDGDMDLSHSPKIGQDITGEGKPNLLISQWTGGAHCCYDVYVFSIGDKFRFIDKISGEDGFIGFKDIDGDGIPEFLGYDWTFAYWNESFAGSPAPKVILRYKNGSYQLAYDLMKKDIKQIQKENLELRSKPIFFKDSCSNDDLIWKKDKVCVNSDVWAYMLNFIYGGHSQEAWDFLNKIWKYDEKTKAVFLADFKRQLALSDYADELPVDLEGYKPDIEDSADKAELRFKVYYDTVLSHYKLNIVNCLPF